MSETVDRLKELLFDQETHELSALRELTLAEKRAREEMLARLEALLARTGTKESLEDSVAEVLGGALRKAEAERHTELASAVAPLVVRTVKTEIRNSKDELVEALYPMTGRMVKAYIASAMKDLANDINRRLESNPLMLRLRSMATGRSMAELAMAESQRLHVEELYLIRRGTGELVARWPEDQETSIRDHVMSGILTAINEFSTEALGDQGSTLRQIDLGERQLYLRASPVYLLAAKCSGVASQPVEAVLDEAFLAAMERINELPSDTSGTLERARLLPALSENLSVQIAERHDTEDGPRFNPLKAIGVMLTVLVGGWVAWSAYQSYRVERTRQIAATVISSIPALDGYPVRLGVGWLGNSINLAGLAPSAEVKDAIGAKLRAALPGIEIDEALTLLPNAMGEIEPKLAGVRKALGDIEPEIARVKSNVDGLDPKIAGVREDVESELDKVRRDVAGLDPRIDQVRSALSGLETSTVMTSLERTERKLKLVSQELPRLSSGTTAPPAVSETEKAVRDTGAMLAAARAAPSSGAGSQELIAKLIAASARLRASANGLAGLLPAGAVAGRADEASQKAPASTLAAADRLADDADWLASVAMSAGHMLALKAALSPREVTAREKLDNWSRSNAIFFGNNTDFRDETRTDDVLATLAQLMQGNDLFVRVVGYTDGKGTSDQNMTLSRDRAEKVVSRLVDLGVPGDRLVAIGRIDTIGISPNVGEASPNRRVEFEVGFDGESGR